jgi:hypothetical protein
MNEPAIIKALRQYRDKYYPTAEGIAPSVDDIVKDNINPIYGTSTIKMPWRPMEDEGL